MEKAAVLYNSSTGTTRNYARAIGEHIKQKGIEVQLSSIQEYSRDQNILDSADYVFLGCWTKGLMVIFQHPEKAWQEFASRLPEMPDAKLALFTTYTLVTGSMFNNMRKHLNGQAKAPTLELKSRDGSLSPQDKQALDQFIVSA